MASAFVVLYRRLFPKSLRGQFAVSLSALALLIVASGATAVYALRASENATRQLAQEHLTRMQDGQDMLQNALLIERATDQLLTTTSSDALHASYANIVKQLEGLDRQVEHLASATGDVAMLDLHQSSQLFRNTANIVAQLRENALQTETAFAQSFQDHSIRLLASRTQDSLELLVLLHGLQGANGSSEVQQLRDRFTRKINAANQLPTALRADLAALRTPPSGTINPDANDLFSMRLKLINADDMLHRFHAELQSQAGSLAVAARLQSNAYTQDYRDAVQHLATASNRSQQLVLAILGCSLLFAWFISRMFMGRNVLARLHQISRHLLQDAAGSAPPVSLPHRADEIGDMARAVDQFLLDRHHLESRTAELGFVKERLAVQNLQLQQEAVVRTGQGDVLEMIAKSAPLEDVLTQLAHLVESQMEGVMVSILLLDDDGLHLRHGAAPSLPKAYTEAIDGVLIGPKAGSCGTAMFRGESVIVTDILQDPLWDDFRAIAAPYGFRACWSTPIMSHERKALGTFALYAREVRRPTAPETQMIEMASRLAGLAIERQQAEERVLHMAHYDALTGLPNRILLEDRLKQAIFHAQRYGRLVTVVFIDLDNFKLVNDSLGHSVGDELLKIVAQRMVACVRRTDTVARLGGDEFVIVLFDQTDQAAAITPTLQKIQEAMAQPILIGGHKLVVSGSMGLATFPVDGTDTETLLRNADAAMYRAKELGRNGYQFYASEMNSQIQEKLALQDGLRHAITHDEFRLLYQPQVDLRSGQIIGVEALIRWQHPELGMVSPVRFIPLAEETGLIVPIGNWVIYTACKQNKAWQDAGLPPMTMSVNISARQFTEKTLVSTVAHALLTSGLDAKYLELELTESMIMQNQQQAIATMRELQVTGVHLSIDDFGTGYSNLSALKSFPISRLKIDQSFVRDIPDDESDKAIAAAVISLGHQLNLRVIAEGVETEAQKSFLRDNGCDEMQGYLFSEPVPSEEIGQLLLTLR